MNAICEDRIAWVRSLSDDDKARLDAEKAAMNNEETKAERGAEIAATFTANDTNADGLLNRAEFANFFKAINQNAAARGVPTQDFDAISDELKESMYAVFAGHNTEAEEVSLASFFATLQAIG